MKVTPVRRRIEPASVQNKIALFEQWGHLDAPVVASAKTPKKAAPVPLVARTPNTPSKFSSDVEFDDSFFCRAIEAGARSDDESRSEECDIYTVTVGGFCRQEVEQDSLLDSCDFVEEEEQLGDAVQGRDPLVTLQEEEDVAAAPIAAVQQPSAETEVIQRIQSLGSWLLEHRPEREDAAPGPIAQILYAAQEGGADADLPGRGDQQAAGEAAAVLQQPFPSGEDECVAPSILTDSTSAASASSASLIAKLMVHHASFAAQACSSLAPEHLSTGGALEASWDESFSASSLSVLSALAQDSFESDEDDEDDDYEEAGLGIASFDVEINVGEDFSCVEADIHSFLADGCDTSTAADVSEAEQSVCDDETEAEDEEEEEDDEEEDTEEECCAHFFLPGDLADDDEEEFMALEAVEESDEEEAHDDDDGCFSADEANGVLDAVIAALEGGRLPAASVEAEEKAQGEVAQQEVAATPISAAVALQDEAEEAECPHHHDHHGDAAGGEDVCPCVKAAQQEPGLGYFVDCAINECIASFLTRPDSSSQGDVRLLPERKAEEAEEAEEEESDDEYDEDAGDEEEEDFPLDEERIIQTLSTYLVSLREHRAEGKEGLPPCPTDEELIRSGLLRPSLSRAACNAAAQGEEEGGAASGAATRPTLASLSGKEEQPRSRKRGVFSSMREGLSLHGIRQRLAGGKRKRRHQKEAVEVDMEIEPEEEEVLRRVIFGRFECPFDLSVFHSDDSKKAAASEDGKKASSGRRLLVFSRKSHKQQHQKQKPQAAGHVEEGHVEEQRMEQRLEEASKAAAAPPPAPPLPPAAAAKERRVYWDCAPSGLSDEPAAAAAAPEPEEQEDDSCGDSDEEEGTFDALKRRYNHHMGSEKFGESPSVSRHDSLGDCMEDCEIV